MSLKKGKVIVDMPKGKNNGFYAKCGDVVTIINVRGDVLIVELNRYRFSIHETKIELLQ